jgi:hypothetical protein
VHLWFASVLPLILAVETRLLEEKTKQALVGSHFVSNTAIPRSVVDYTACLYIHPLGEDRSSLIRIRFPGVNTLDDSELVMTMRSHKGDLTQLVLVISMAVFLFCLHGLKVLWPKGFNKGELRQHDVDCHSNWWRMLIARQANGSLVPSSLSGCLRTFCFW